MDLKCSWTSLPRRLIVLVHEKQKCMNAFNFKSNSHLLQLLLIFMNAFPVKMVIIIITLNCQKGRRVNGQIDSHSGPYKMQLPVAWKKGKTILSCNGRQCCLPLKRLDKHLDNLLKIYRHSNCSNSFFPSGDAAVLEIMIYQWDTVENL